MGYKIYKDSYLKSLTKDELISLLRTAEHNYLATEEALQSSSAYGKQLAEEVNRLKKLANRQLPNREQGRWVAVKNYKDYEGTICTIFECSICHKKQNDETPPFCPECGAKMEDYE